jgi:type VI secretion system secreted protein Hcp
MAAQGSNLFLKMTGITGESQESKHTGEIEIFGYSEGLSNLSSGGTGMGGGVGRVEYRDFTFQCKLEKAVPTLMSWCADHKVISEAKMSGTKVGGSGASYDYVQITMKNCRIAAVDLGGSMNAEGSVSISLNFEEIKTEYWEESASGGQGASTNAAWSNKANKKM